MIWEGGKMAQLTAPQRQAWLKVLDLVGLPHSAGMGSVRITGSEGCLSAKPGRISLATPHRVKLSDIEQARSLVSGGTGAAAGTPSREPAAKSGESVRPFKEGDERELRHALFAQVVDRIGQVAGSSDAISKRFFPLQVTVYAGEDIEIKKGEVLTIEPDGHDPVVVNYGTVTLEQGGQIRCQAPVLLIVQKFIKKK